MDGTAFAGSDSITIKGKKKKKKKVTVGEVSRRTDLRVPNPNPFNPVTRISYALSETRHVRLTIYDVAGRLVKELVNNVKDAGEHVVEWDAGTLPSGVYFVRLQTGSGTLVRRATLLK